MEKAKCVIIGSGPAGYTAAIYVARANLQPVLYQGPQPGGQLMITPTIENYPGFTEGIDPFTLLNAMCEQAKKYGADIREGIVKEVKFERNNNLLTIDDGSQITAQCVIIATGASAKFLGLPSEKAFMGKGVSACATCDGFFFRGKTVAVVGGGDTACEEALYLANLCPKVYMIARKPFLRASQILQDRVKENPNITILFEHVTQEIVGKDTVEGVKLLYQNEKIVDLPIDGLFIAIGHHPNTQMFGSQLPLDAEGYFIKEKLDKANGVFVAGDCSEPHYKQAVIAAGEGCKSALDAIEFLKQ